MKLSLEEVTNPNVDSKNCLVINFLTWAAKTKGKDANL